MHLNPSLNCIIGGKGTGKSTIIETLRFCFDEKAKADKIGEQYEEIVKEAFGPGSRISALVETHEPIPRRYIIERTYPDPPNVRDESGKLMTDLRPADIVKVEVYGQKEIYEISKDRNFQFNLLDGFVGDKLDELKKQEAETLRSLEKNKTDLLQLREKITYLAEEVGTLPALEEKIKAYKSTGVLAKIGEKRLYTKEEDTLKLGSEKLARFSQLLGEFSEAVDLDACFLSKPDDEMPNAEILQQAGHVIDDFAKYVREEIGTQDDKGKLYSALSQAEKQYQVVVGKWDEKNKKQNERFAEILRKLPGEMKDAGPNELIQFERQADKLKLSKSEMKKDKLQYEELEKQRKSLLGSLRDNRFETHRLRDGKMRQLNDKIGGTVRVKLEYQGEKTGFTRELKRLKSSVREDTLNRIVESTDFSVAEFCSAVRDGAERLVEKYEMNPGSAELLMKAISPEKLYQLETFEIPTKPTIELNLGSQEESKFRDIQHLSVGQKCTALLTLILLENPYPLIIDQPEDDLDNAFIVSDIVQKLREEKENRQFVIATHNANIPVLGDAQFIVPLKATATNATIEQQSCGSIDDEPVKDVVKQTLEGGKQAFEIRKRKYGI